MNLTEQIKEYKEKVEALATKAALADQLQEQLNTLTEEKSAADIALTEKIASFNEELKKAAELSDEVANLKAEIERMNAEKKAADEKALEIVAGLGLNQIPVVTITNTEKPSAEQIRAKYLAISDSVEKAKFYAENRSAILNGVTFDN